MAMAVGRGKSQRSPRGHRAATLLCALAVVVAGCGVQDDGEHPGQAVYMRHCFACHQSGVAGAPRLGDKEEWAPRLAKGRDTLVDNVIRGMTPGMPPRGACASCTDEALRLAVDFMVAGAQ